MCNKIEKCWNKATPGANITCANPLTMACQTDYSSPTTVTCATSCTNAETPSRTRCCFWTNCNKVTKAGCWNPGSAQLAPLVYGALYCKTSPNFGLTAEATTCQPSSNMLCCSINSDKPCNKVTRCNNKGTYVNCDTSAKNKDVACAIRISDRNGMCVGGIAATNKIAALTSAASYYLTGEDGHVECWDPSTNAMATCTAANRWSCKVNINLF
jgi:hypothetical protein